MNYNDDQLRELEILPYVALFRRSPAPAITPTMRAPMPVVTPEVPRAQEDTPSRPEPITKRASRSVVKVPVEKASTTIGRVEAQGLDWTGLQAAVDACTACGLCKQRKQAVLGVGATNAPWLFVGEAPGSEEDEQGEPFVGQAGKLLDAMLKAAGLERGREVYIANVVKCRPPGNRTPTGEEALTCAPYLDRQIELIAPSLIVALGKTAVTRLTGEDASMAVLRGQLHHYRGIPLIATYHPAYLLRSLPEKIKAWEDLMLAKKTFSTLPPKPA